jgi:hypothetical protein
MMISCNLLTHLRMVNTGVGTSQVDLIWNLWLDKQHKWIIVSLNIYPYSLWDKTLWIKKRKVTY